jgi:chromosome partitioning protein
MSNARIISIINQKGGVGKTTTSINLSCGLALKGHRTLLIDLDPQAHSTIGLGIEPGSYELGIHNVFLDKVAISKCILETSIENLHMAPAHLRLDRAEQILSPELFKEAMLHNAIAGLDYEFIVIDCRPSLGTLTVNALYACNWIIVPVEMSRYALEGFADLMETVEVVKRAGKDHGVTIRILFTKLDQRNKITNDWVLGELDAHKDLIFQTVIHRNEALNQAHIVRAPIFICKPNSTGARDYQQLTEEILSLCRI